jgi:DNA-binding HxlR family transcriptional regulator
MTDTEEQIMATIPIIRPVLEQISDKWSILVLTFICHKPQRFNVIKRRLDGITQKALTETLRRMERNGLVDRRVIPTSPVAVEYSITPLGRTLQGPFTEFYEWAVSHQPDIVNAQEVFDARKAEGGDVYANGPIRRPAGSVGR